MTDKLLNTYQSLKKNIRDEYDQACLSYANYHSGKNLEYTLKLYESIYFEKIKQLDDYFMNKLISQNEPNIVSKY